MIKPARPHPEHNRTSDTILQTAGTGRRKPIQGFPEPVPAVFSSLCAPHIPAALMPPVQRRSETKKENRLHTPHALTITPVTVSDVVHVERTAQGTRIPDARREHDGRNHHHRRLLAPRPADGMEHVRRRGTSRPAYGRAPPCRWSVQWQGFCESPCLISSACHVDCAEPYGRMAGRFRDMS